MTDADDKTPESDVIQLPVLPTVTSEEELVSEPSEEPLVPQRKSRRQILLAKRRQMAFLEKRREQKRRKVFYRRLKRLAGVMYLFMIAAAVFFVVTSSVWKFDGSNFKLHNAQLLTEKNIRPLIAAYQSWPMIQIDPEDISAAIKAQYNIAQEVYVRRALFPPRLDITVVEKQPFAELYTADKASAPYGLMTQDNSIIPLALYPYNPQRSPYKHPLPRVILPANSSLNATAMALMAKVTTQLTQVPNLHLQELKFITTPAPAGSRKKPMVTLEAQFQEIRVLLGALDWELPKRLARLNALVPKILELKGLISEVDLRWSTQVTFKKKSVNPLGDILGQSEQVPAH